MWVRAAERQLLNASRGSPAREVRRVSLQPDFRLHLRGPDVRFTMLTCLPLSLLCWCLSKEKKNCRPAADAGSR